MVTYYYVDPSNCADNTGSGLKYTGLTVDSTADTTHITDAGLNAKVIPVGSYVWVAGRSGSLISAWDDGTDTITLGTAISGLTAGDSYYLITPKKTVGAATALTLSAGDIIYVRAGTTDTLAAIINCTSDGSTAAYISCIGMGTGSATLETTDGTATEAWHDASTTRPIIDGNNAAYYFNIQGDDYWQLKYLDIRNTNSTSGCLNVQLMYTNCIVSYCTLRDATNANGANLNIANACAVADNCTILNANYISINVGAGRLDLTNSTVDGGALAPNYGIRVSNAIVYLNECVFGGSATNTTDIYINYDNSKCYTKNCDFNSSTKVSVDYTGITSLQVFEEDAQRVYGDHIATGYLGVATRVTDITRSGGATSSVKIIPTTYVGILRPFILQDFPKPTWQVWCPTGAQTITVYVRGLNWASYPTAAQLYLEAEYVTDDTTEAITRSTVVSTQVLTDNTTWTGLSCAVNPHIAGFVNLKLYLGLYEDATTGIYVDIAPIVS